MSPSGSGVASGEAEFEDGDYFGLPVVEAARLCAKAEGGEILATEFVRMLARSRSTVVLEPVGALELKGLDEPVETFRVVWSPIDPSASRPPLPARLASAVSSTFVGRGDEHERLMTAWKAIVAGGSGRLMLLAGEPGIGKTTLAARFASEVYDQDVMVVYGRSDEDLGVPYQPWIEALTQLVTQIPEPMLAAHVAARGAHLARLVPDVAARLGVEVPAGADADAERFVLYGCVTDLLAPRLGSAAGIGGARRSALGGPCDRAAVAPGCDRGTADAGRGVGDVSRYRRRFRGSGVGVARAVAS